MTYLRRVEMSSKVLLGLMVSAMVGLGAAAAPADEVYKPRYDVKKAAIIDKDDYFCKVPIKNKHEKIILSSDDAKIDKKVFWDHGKKFLLLKCSFKDKVGYGYFYDFKDQGFKCKARYDYYDLKTNKSIVHVDFDRYSRYNKYSKYNRHIVAKVYLACLFKLDHDKKDDKKDDNKDDNGHNY